MNFLLTFLKTSKKEPQMGFFFREFRLRVEGVILSGRANQKKERMM